MWCKCKAVTYYYVWMGGGVTVWWRVIDSSRAAEALSACRSSLFRYISRTRFYSPSRGSSSKA